MRFRMLASRCACDRLVWRGGERRRLALWRLLELRVLRDDVALSRFRFLDVLFLRISIELSGRWYQCYVCCRPNGDEAKLYWCDDCAHKCGRAVMLDVFSIEFRRDYLCELRGERRVRPWTKSKLT